MKGLKTYISIVILIFINFLFAYKYISRHFDYGIYLSLLICFTQLIIFLGRDRIKLSSKLKNVASLLIMGFIFCLIVISYKKIPLESLNVDRWSVIYSFLEELFNGNYPYYAQSFAENYPGPMPFYFFIAFPFYIIGELSILSSIGYFFMVFYIFFQNSQSKNTSFILFYLITCFFLIWEITTRSNIFTFSIFVTLVLYEFTNLNKRKSNTFYFSAVLTGLLLSTRSVYIIPYIIFFLSTLINNETALKKLFIFTLTAFISFIFTFIPFILFFKNDFLKMNPFIIQSSFLIPIEYIILFIFISIALTFLVKNKIDKFFYSGFALFISISIYFLYHVVNSGFEKAYFGSIIDISYFIFCIPFLIMFLLTKPHKCIPKHY